MCLKKPVFDGGTRGGSSGVSLVESERRTRTPAANLFDLIAGTSTGGMICCGLLKGMSANVCQLLEALASRITAAERMMQSLILSIRCRRKTQKESPDLAVRAFKVWRNF
jgi:patatin-like phospholipase/acyl hydrolase